MLIIIDTITTGKLKHIIERAVMTISVGDMLPNHTLTRFSTNGLESSKLYEIIPSGLSIIFGVPGAYSRTCSKKHLPSFIKTMPKFKEIGVNKVVCISVNDPFVMANWGIDSGAVDAGIEMFCDPTSTFISEIGLNFNAAPIGFFNRSKRFSMIVEDKKVKVLNVDEDSGTCDLSAGETIHALL